MGTYTATTEVSARPSQVIGVLTDPAEARRWSPVEFELEGESAARLEAGTRAVVGGKLAGRRVSFDLSVLEADRRRLELTASGPVRLTASYVAEVSAAGTELHASVSVASAGGIRGRLASTATEAMLAGGALDAALRRIADGVAAAA